MTSRVTRPVTPAPATVMVLGGAGFLGTALVEDLWREGREVHVADLAAAVDARGLERATSVHAVSLEDGAGLLHAMEACRPDVVVDLAYLVGPPAEESVARATRVNLLGPALAMQAAHAAGVRRYVQASSIAVYGPSTEAWGRPVTESDMLPLPQHETTYGAFKCVNEFQLRTFTAQTGLETSSVRLSVVLGPAKTRGLATWPGRALADARAGVREHEVPVPSGARINLIAAQDAVTLVRRVVDHPRPGAIYNSGGHDVSAEDVVALIASRCPATLFTFDEDAANIPFVHSVSNDLARADLGLQLEPLVETVDRFLGMPR